MRLQGKLLAAGVAAALSLGVMAAPAAEAAKPTIVIWADAAHAPGLRAAAKTYTAALIKVVTYTKDVRANVKTVALKDAPDIIEGAHDWVGELASNAAIVAISLPAPIKAQFEADDLSAMTYNGNLYGLPMLHEALAFVINTDMMGTTCPTTMSAFLAKANTVSGLTTPIQVTNDPYHFFPMLSGLGGYFFKRITSGTNKGGYLIPRAGQVNKTLDTAKAVGFDSDALLSHASVIEGWRTSGLFQRYTGNANALNGLFSQKKAAAWITGPWNATNLLTMATRKVNPIKMKQCKFPTLVTGIKSVPFRGIRGLMITKYANQHGVLAAAKALVTTRYATSAAQSTYGKVGGFNAANKKASGSTNPFVKGFMVAYADAPPMPNIPQMSNVWTFGNSCWSKSLKATGYDSVPSAFGGVANSIRAAIAG